MRPRFRLGCALGLTLLGVQGLHAVAQEDRPAAAELTEEDTEFMQLLEFLGEFSTSEGEWIDPIELEEGMEAGELARPQDGGVAAGPEEDA